MFFALYFVLLSYIFADKLFILLNPYFEIEGIELNLTLVYFSDAQYEKRIAKRLVNLKIFTQYREFCYKVISKKNTRLYRNVSVFNGEYSIEGYFIGKYFQLNCAFLEKSKRLMGDMSIKVKKETLSYLFFDAIFTHKKKVNDKKMKRSHLFCGLNEGISDNVFQFHSERQLTATIKKALKDKVVAAMLEFLVKKSYETYYRNVSD